MRDYTNRAFCESAFRGAVYFPARAYNAYQTYEYYDSAEIDRDFGYAEKAGLRALRIFTSFEQWQKDGDAFFAKYDDLLEKAGKHGIKVLSILFEHCGRDFSFEHAMDRDPLTAVCVRSPRIERVEDSALWGPCYDYVDAFFDRYDGNENIAAIEIMNEPNFRTNDVIFARAMLERAYARHGKSGLSMGGINLGDSMMYGDMLDVIQIHENVPTTEKQIEDFLKQAKRVMEMAG